MKRDSKYSAAARQTLRRLKDEPWAVNLTVERVLERAKFARENLCGEDESLKDSIDFLLQWEFQDVDRVLAEKDTVGALQVGIEIGSHWASILSKLSIPVSTGPRTTERWGKVRELYHERKKRGESVTVGQMWLKCRAEFKIPFESFKTEYYKKRKQW